MHIVDTSLMPWRPVTNNARTGDVERKFVREGELAPGVGFTSDMVRYVGGPAPFSTPRHRHDFEQIRIAIDGRMDFGHDQITEPDWVAYFPAGAFYGPQHIDGATIFIVQWSDAWVTRALHDEAVRELSKVGTIEGGVYTYVDESGATRQQDSLNAVWEHVFQRPAAFPVPKYPDPILMNPNAFEWRPHSDTTSWKLLGRFTDRDLQVFRVRWDRAGAYRFDDTRTYCVLTLADGFEVAGARRGLHTVVWSDIGEHTDVVGLEGSEAIVIGFPPASS